MNELAKILREAHNTYSRASWDSHLYKALASAVIGAGYAPVRRIPVPVDLDNSPELDGCPNGTVLFDSDEDVMVKYDGKWRFWGVDYEDDDEEGTVCLPATVVHYPT
jgi:hypothetical protein